MDRAIERRRRFGVADLAEPPGRQDTCRDKKNPFSSLVHWRIIQIRLLFA